MRKLGDILPVAEKMRAEHIPHMTWDQIYESNRQREREIDEKAFRTWLYGKKKQTGVPKAYLDSEKDIEAFPSREWSIDWAVRREDQPLGLYIFGSAGVGKTYEACGIVLQRRVSWVASQPSSYQGKAGGGQLFTSLASILDRTYATGVTRDEVLQKYISCDFLVLDDLGKEKPSEYTLETLYRLIDGRIANNNQTVITSNLSPEQMIGIFAQDGGRYVGDAILSRLQKYEIINMAGEDRRLA